MLLSGCERGDHVLMLRDFLEKRIEEEEAVLDEMDGGETLPREPAASRPHWDRERLLDECLSKRVVLATFGSYLGQTDRTRANSYEIEAWRVLEQAVKGMALPYARHPDYQPHWRINLV